MDVIDEDSVEAGLAQVTQVLGGLDIVVTAAGVTVIGGAELISVADWRRVIDVNLTGTWLVASRAARHMLSSAAEGSIITMSSQYAAIVGRQTQAAYYASKAGVTNLTRAMAVEYGRRGIRVNSIAPGPFYPTAMTRGLLDDPDKLAWLAQRTILGRLGEPEGDIGGAVVFLASVSSRYITGQVLCVDGGWTAW